MVDIEISSKAGKSDGNYYVTPEQNVESQLTHEGLHALVNGENGIENTVFTEALFDLLCGREEAGLWFAQETFSEIRNFLEKGEKQNG